MASALKNSILLLVLINFGIGYSNSNPAQLVKTFLIKRTQLFLSDLYTLREKENTGVHEAELCDYFLNARISFKRVQFMLSYSNNLEAKEINGPNLVVNNYNSRTPNEEIHPHGLQVIEALIYAPDELSRPTLKFEIDRLIRLIEKILKRYQDIESFDEEQLNKVVWDALRYEMFRIEALGICGFDVPLCMNAIPETQASIESFREIVSFYKPVLEISREKKLFETGNMLLNKTVSYLKKNQDFNTFDRFEFIVDFLHPLSNWISKVQEETGFKIDNLLRPVNNNASTLFDKAIFDPYYFPEATDTLKIKLGERLFHDSIFSLNQSRSCASCHLPELAYADGKKQNTVLGSTESLKRNTPSLFNVGYQSRFFYDSRVTSLDKQILDVIHNKKEMGGDFSMAVQLIAKDSLYRKQFTQIYRNGLTEMNVLHALATFVRSLVSFDSKFDKNIRGEENTLTEQEKQGFNLFAGKAKCATCHFPPLFNGLVPPFYEETESEILGVPIHVDKPLQIDSDAGKFEFTGLELHRNSFKTPGVRNVEHTAPYMHNGVFNTLEEVVDFYNKGGGLGQGMEIQNQTLSPDPLSLTEQEIMSVILFLKTLNESSDQK